MYKFIIATFVLMLVIGCGEVTNGNTYKIDGNATLPPLEDNQTITSGTNVSNVTISDSGVYVICGDGGTCNVTIGDNNGNTIDANQSQVVVGGDINDSHAVATTTTQLWYYTATSSCCYSCGACDNNVTPPDVNTTSLGVCNPNYSGGPAWCYTEVSGG